MAVRDNLSGGNKPKEIVIKGASEISSGSSVKFDLTLPCKDFSKLEVEYFDSNTVKIYGIDNEGSQTVVKDGSVKSKITIDIDSYVQVRFYGVNTSGNFFNGFTGNIRFYNE